MKSPFKNLSYQITSSELSDSFTALDWVEQRELAGYLKIIYNEAEMKNGGMKMQSNFKDLIWKDKI